MTHQSIARWRHRACSGLVLALVVCAPRWPSAQSQGRSTGNGQADPRQVANAVASIVADHYFDASVGAAAGAQIRRQATDGVYGERPTRESLAAAISRDLFLVTRDKHLVVSVVKEAPEASGPADNSRERRAERDNAGVRQAAVLAGNVGYVNVTSFYRLAEVGDAFDAAMRLVAHTDALIVDMRENGGGSPESVALLASYFFEAPAMPLFDIIPRTGPSQTYRTASPAPAARSAARPAYVLTSSRTFSAGEGFAYILQDQHRAEIVGEQTAGAANPGRPYEAGDGFEVTVPNGRVESAGSRRNWEGTGVTPDVPVAAAEARTRAHELALRALLARTPAGAWHDTLEREIAQLRSAAASTPR
jgi:retinol-binding protein 3